MEVLPDLTNDLLMWTLLVGALTPLVIAIPNQTHWSKTAKGIVTLLICILVGGGTAYFNHAFTGRGIVSCVLIVAVMAVFTYHQFWKTTGIAPALERATTPGPSMR